MAAPNSAAWQGLKTKGKHKGVRGAKALTRPSSTAPGAGAAKPGAKLGKTGGQSGQVQGETGGRRQ